MTQSVCDILQQQGTEAPHGHRIVFFITIEMQMTECIVIEMHKHDLP